MKKQTFGRSLLVGLLITSLFFGATGFMDYHMGNMNNIEQTQEMN